MMEKFRKWLASQSVETDKDDVGVNEIEQGAIEELDRSNSLVETGKILDRTQAKVQEVATELKGAREIIREENQRRLAMIRGDRGDRRE